MAMLAQKDGGARKAMFVSVSLYLLSAVSSASIGFEKRTRDCAMR